MEKVALRRYKDSDRNTVWQLHIDGLNQTGSFIFNPNLDSDFDDIKGIYLDNNGEFLIATLDNIIIGMGALRKVNQDIAEIKRMRVDSSHQGQGVGSMILEKLIARAKELGYKKLVLDTSEKQEAAGHLYQKYGFKEYNRKKLGNHYIIFYKLELM